MNTTGNNEFKEKSDEELKTTLKSIINPKFEENIADWIYYSKPNEKKGLYILSKVIKYKGEKMFKTQLTRTKEEENDISKLTLEEAFKRYQKKKNVSSYAEFYGGNLDDKYKYNSILKFKEFKNLNYAELIKQNLYSYVTAWVGLEKTEQYKEYVLDFLRSFLSTVRSNRKFVTHNKDTFTNFKQTDKYTSHAPYLLNKQPKLEERVPTYEEMSARLNLEYLKLAKPADETTHISINQREEIEKRKKELTQGNRNIIKGIYSNTTSSCYQDVYKGLPMKYPFAITADKYSSGIKGIVPDAYVMNRIRSATEISDNLKNTVNTIMFSDNYNKYR